VQLRPSNFGDGIDVVVEGAWDPAVERLIWNGDVQGVVFGAGFAGRDISFIRGLPLARVFMIARGVEDISALSTLGELEFLHVLAAVKATFDVSGLRKLRDLRLGSWSHLANGLHDAPPLDALYVGRYSESDLQPIAHVGSLRSVKLEDRPRLTSLAGVEELRDLQVLETATARNLVDITDVRHVGASLRHLDLESSRRFTDLEPISHLPNLEFLSLANCGELESVGPLRDLVRLDSLWMFESTVIEDGDLSPLLGLPLLEDLRLMNRRHYRPNVSVVKAAIEDRMAAGGTGPVR
jgi:hypothetical protein